MGKSVKMKVFKILLFLVTLVSACEPNNKPKDLIEEKKNDSNHDRPSYNGWLYVHNCL